MRNAILALAALALTGAADAPRPYLLPADAPDLSLILPPPPAPGSAEAAADRAVFERTRALRGTPRWELATRDVMGNRYDTFSCALAGRLDARTAPALARLFGRIGDAGAVDRAKRRFGVQRPYLGTDRPICEAKTAHLAGNPDYPSGHTSSGWSTALVLAELVPDRAAAILRRGRQFGESRYVCGSHSLSAVEAGYLSGAALVARLHGSAEFRRDLEAARAELARVLPAAPAPDAAGCRLERSADARP